MSRLDTLYRLHRLLNGRRTGIARETLAHQLGISRASLTRAIREMRDHYDAPLAHDPERGGYLYDTRDHQFELPGLWFTADELHAIAALDHWLETLEPGLLEGILRPAREHIQRQLDRHTLDTAALPTRLRIIGANARPHHPERLARIAHATLQRQRLRITHHHRGRNDTTERLISPQRLVHYRDTWYLDTWCHQREALRTFALDAIAAAHPTGEIARDIDAAELDRELGSSYGIFAGEATATAVLRFSATRARWVANERWHPDQTATPHADGRLDLHIPYADPRELIMDILRHGPEVEVIAPESLRHAIRDQLDRAAQIYRNPSPAGSSSEPEHC